VNVAVVEDLTADFQDTVMVTVRRRGKDAGTELVDTVKLVDWVLGLEMTEVPVNPVT
jgi:hypothetical protein